MNPDLPLAKGLLLLLRATTYVLRLRANEGGGGGTHELAEALRRDVICRLAHPAALLGPQLVDRPPRRALLRAARVVAEQQGAVDGLRGTEDGGPQHRHVGHQDGDEALPERPRGRRVGIV